MKIIDRYLGKIIADIEKNEQGFYDLENANLENANLENVDLFNANLKNADLKYADLENANLFNADLENANLRKANLRKANLRKANLRNANLEDADLRNADLKNVNLFNADLKNANLKNANLKNVNLFNGFESSRIMHISGLEYHVYLLDSHIKIGCECHAIDSWRDFTDIEILSLDGEHALRFWRENKEMILARYDNKNLLKESEKLCKE